MVDAMDLVRTGPTEDHETGFGVECPTSRIQIPSGLRIENPYIDGLRGRRRNIEIKGLERVWIAYRARRVRSVDREEQPSRLLGRRGRKRQEAQKQPDRNRTHNPGASGAEVGFDFVYLAEDLFGVLIVLLHHPMLEVRHQIGFGIVEGLNLGRIFSIRANNAVHVVGSNRTV